jgi:hypothetical protein
MELKLGSKKNNLNLLSGKTKNPASQIEKWGLNSEHTALRNGMLFRFIFVFFQYVVKTLFDDIV